MPQFRFWNPYDAQWHYLSERDLGAFPNAIIYEEDEGGNQIDIGTVASLGYFNNNPGFYESGIYEEEPLDYRTNPFGERVSVNSTRAFWDQYRNPQGLSYNERIANLGLQMDENTGIYYLPESNKQTTLSPNGSVQLEPSPKVAVNPNTPVQLEPSPKVAVNPNAQVQEVVLNNNYRPLTTQLSKYITLKSNNVNYGDLHPEMQTRVDRFGNIIHTDTGGRMPTMTEGYRSFVGQQALAGRSNAAKPGRSLHGFGIAADIRYYGAGGLQELANLAYQRDNAILKRYGVTKADDLVDAWAAKAGLVRNLHKAGMRNEEHHFQMLEDDAFRKSVNMARILRERAKFLSGRNPGRTYLIAR